MSKKFFAILLLAFLVRLFFVFGFVTFVMPDLYPFVDGDGYLEAAEEFQKGDLLLNSAYYRRLPFYPSLLAFVNELPISDLVISRLWHIILDLFTLVLVYGYAKKIAAENAAIIGSLLYAIYPLAIYRLGMINTEIIQATLLFMWVLSALRLYESKRLFHAFLFSLLTTVYVFINPAAQFLPFLYVLWLLIRMNWKLSMKLGISILLPYIVLVLLWGVRNYYVMNEFYLFDVRGGKEFWVGNNQQFDGWEEGPHRELMLEKVRYYRGDYAQEHNLSPNGVNRLFFQKGWQEIKADPLGSMILFGKKFLRFWFVPASGRMMEITIPLQSFYLILAITGIWLGGIKRKEIFIPSLVILYFSGIYTVTFACIRYSHPVMPLVSSLAGVGIMEWWRKRKEGVETTPSLNVFM